jgi:formylglycine-generating enzyme required for sulfatase activity
MNERKRRDLGASETGSDVPIATLLPRRKFVVVIGIDNYVHLPRLRCAVNDALGFQALLVRHLGFEAPIPALTNGAATKPAIEAVIEDQLRRILQPDDALILFFAGHGTTRVAHLEAMTVETGYLAPVEARAPDQFSDLVNMEELLRKVGMLPARHILVILDACHSGLALGSAVSGYRSLGAYLNSLASNRSRRVITSARRHELAQDSGPIAGHSLFTGLLIRTLTSGEADLDGNGVVTFSELALLLQQQVGQASGSRQTPDYGAFHLDDRGEMVLALRNPALAQAGAMVRLPYPSAQVSGVASARAPDLPAPARGSRRKRALLLGLGAALLGGVGLWFALRDSAPLAGALAAVGLGGAAGPCPPRMAFIPGGAFMMGSEPGYDDEKPVHPVRVEAFCLDMDEVTAGDYDVCFKRRKCSDRAFPKDEPAKRGFDTYCTLHKPGMGNHPVNCINWQDASAYCLDQGKRLPSEAEWEYAAAGGEQQLPYPWGNRAPSARLVNACGPECSEMFYRIYPRDQSANILPYAEGDGFPGTAPVGSFPAGASRWGPRDMAGNVAEWTSSAYCPYSSQSQCTPDEMVIRGGTWLSFKAKDLRTNARLKFPSDSNSIAVGFRCARNANSPRPTP